MFGFPQAGAGSGGVAPPVVAIIDAPITATITLAALASGAARQSVYLDNSVLMRPAAKVTLTIQTGGVAPTLGTIVELWLLRSSSQALAGLVGDDGTTSVDAAYPIPPTLPRNATLIGSLSVTANANTVFKATFDTRAVGVLGDFYGFAVANRTNQALNAAGNSVVVEAYTSS